MAAFGLLALVALAAAGIAALFTRDMARHRARLSGVSRIVDTALGPIEVAEAGAGTPLVIVHGAGGGFDQGLDLAGALIAPGVRLIVPSRFGYLRSPLPAGASVERQADAFAALLDALGVAQAFFIGFSAGAWSCLAFAVRHPARCRALVLCVPAGRLPPGLIDFGGAPMRAVFNHDLLAWAVIRLFPLLPAGVQRALTGTEPARLAAVSAEERARAWRILEHMLPMRARKDGMHFDMATLAAPPSCAFEKIVCPVLTLSADDDVFGTAARAREIAAAVPLGRAVIYASGGHALVGHDAEATREITAFLRDAARQA